MKWFKHYSNANTNKFIYLLLSEKNGHQLYAMYFLLLEVLCGEFKKDSETFIVSKKQLLDGLHVKSSARLEAFLFKICMISEVFEENRVKYSKLDENFYELDTPIIKELMGKEFKRTRQCSGTAALKKKKKKKEEEEEKDNKRVRAKFDFESVYQKYPKKMGKKKGMERCKSQIKTEKQWNELNQAVMNYSEAVSSTESKFIKHFSSFITEWTDWIDYKAPSTPESELARLKAEILAEGGVV